MGNELKLSLENFQSISQGELIFHTGTNVIVGQSNSGKTATFRALKACLSNPSGSQRFIKKGTKGSSVMLEYNGNQIIWKRTPKESSYIINGESYIKTGNSSAFKLLEDTGFVIDSNDTIMNIEEELQLPFPFGISKNDLFKLFENVFCVSDSAIILKAAKGVEDTTKLKITTLENEIIKNENKLKELSEFKDIVSIEKLQKMKKYLEGKNNRVLSLKDGLPIIKKAIKIQGLTIDKKEFQNLLPLYSENKNLKKTISQLKQLHNVNKSLKDIPKPVEIPLSSYKELRELNKTLKVLECINNLEAPVKDFENKIEKYKELNSYLKDIQTIKEKIGEKKKLLEENKLKIAQVEKALKSYKVCPLCHKPL